MSAATLTKPSTNGTTKHSEQCSQPDCDHVGTDVVDSEEHGLICAACADAMLDQETSASPAECDACEHVGHDVDALDRDGPINLCKTCQSLDEDGDAAPETQAAPSAPPAPVKPAGADKIATAQEALWDQAIGIDNAVAFGVTTSAVEIGRLILQSFDLMRDGLAHGRETRDAYGLVLQGFGRRYELKTKRVAQTSRWINAYVAHSLAGEDEKALILGSETAPFSCDTLVALADKAHDPDPTTKTRPGLVTVDTDSVTWMLEDNTDDGATRYNTLIANVVKEGYTADQVRKEVKKIKRDVRAQHESQQDKELREQQEKAERTQARSDAVDRAVKKLVETATTHKVGKHELTATLVGKSLIENPRESGAYNPATMTPEAAAEFAAELILAQNVGAITAILKKLEAFAAGVNADKQQGKKATPPVDDSPKANKANKAKRVA